MPDLASGLEEAKMAIDMTRKDLLSLAGIGAVIAAAGVTAPARAAASAAALMDIPGFRGQDPNGTYYLIAHAGTYDGIVRANKYRPFSASNRGSGVRDSSAKTVATHPPLSCRNVV